MPNGYEKIPTCDEIDITTRPPEKKEHLYTRIPYSTLSTPVKFNILKYLNEQELGNLLSVSKSIKSDINQIEFMKARAELLEPIAALHRDRTQKSKKIAELIHLMDNRPDRLSDRLLSREFVVCLLFWGILAGVVSGGWVGKVVSEEKNYTGPDLLLPLAGCGAFVGPFMFILLAILAYKGIRCIERATDELACEVNSLNTALKASANKMNTFREKWAFESGKKPRFGVEVYHADRLLLFPAPKEQKPSQPDGIGGENACRVLMIHP